MLYIDRHQFICFPLLLYQVLHLNVSTSVFSSVIFLDCYYSRLQANHADMSSILVNAPAHSANALYLSAKALLYSSTEISLVGQRKWWSNTTRFGAWGAEVFRRRWWKEPHPLHSRFIIIASPITNKIRIILSRFDSLIWCIHIRWCKLRICMWSGALPVLWKIWMTLLYGYRIELMILYIIITASASFNKGVAFFNRL